jgi:hypothetical protein
MFFHFRGIFRQAIACVMVLALSQNLLAATMASCNCPCCTKKPADNPKICTHNRVARAVPTCCRAEKEKHSCCANTKKAVENPCDSSSVSTLKSSPCRCDMHTAPALPVAIKDSAKSSAKQFDLASGWMMPIASARILPELAVFSDPPPYPGPSLQRLLCIWRK